MANIRKDEPCLCSVWEKGRESSALISTVWLLWQQRNGGQRASQRTQGPEPAIARAAPRPDSQPVKVGWGHRKELWIYQKSASGIYEERGLWIYCSGEVKGMSETNP